MFFEEYNTNKFIIKPWHLMQFMIVSLTTIKIMINLSLQCLCRTYFELARTIIKYVKR